MTFKDILRRRARKLTKPDLVERHGVSSVILWPVQTEKAYNVQGNWEYHFYVDTSANKNDVRVALKTIYNVDALSVRTVLVPAKYRAQRWLVRSAKKKAIVTLASWQDLTL